MNNILEIKLALTAVSRDCFPIELSQKRRQAVMKYAEEMKLMFKKVQVISKLNNWLLQLKRNLFHVDILQ